LSTIDRSTIRATDHTIDRLTARRAGAALALASGLAIAGFIALGLVFEYPQILEEPTADILALFREHQGAVMGWFLVLAVSAALMAPAGIWLGRIAGGRLGRWIAGVGIAAATVQVVGLQRWVTLVPSISDDALDPALRANAEERFELWHTVLGKAIGETLGYVLTATFTVLVVVALSRTILPRWLAIVGLVASGLIATGVVVPLVEAASLTNFAGYVVWCAWLLAVAFLLVRAPAGTVGSPTTDRPAGFTATASIVVRRPIAEVFEFVADARNRPSWDGSVVTEELTSAEPIRQGTTVHTRLRSMGRELDYDWVVTSFEPPVGMVVTSTVGPLPTTLTYLLTDLGHATRVEFSVVGRPTGALRLLRPAMARSTQRNLDRSFARLQQVLEARASRRDG
jgi:hypothetical protein